MLVSSGSKGYSHLGLKLTNDATTKRDSLGGSESIILRSDPAVSCSTQLKIRTFLCIILV